MIHSSAIIDPSAKLAADVQVGPWSIIGADVEIGAGTVIHSHVVIKGPTKMGERNQIFPFSVVGEIPQDKKFNGENSLLIMGDENVVRENVTINRGTETGGGVTKIGNNNLFMACSHVAHDVIIGNHNVFANYCALGGHCVIEDYVGFGGYSGAHQFCHVGAHSYVAKATVIGKDVLPYVLVAGNEPKAYGLNTVGLQRRGFPEDTIAVLKGAYKTVCRKGLTVSVAIDELKSQAKDQKEVQSIIKFLEASERGIIR